MNRKQTTAFLSNLLINTRLSGVGKYYSREVTLDWGTQFERRVDFMEFQPPSQLCVGDIEKGIFICYEVKSCKEDVYSGNGLNFVGEKNYIVTTMDCYKEIQEDIKSGKLQQHVLGLSPDNCPCYGIMVAAPVLSDLTQEYEKPTKLGAPGDWELKIVIPGRQYYRRKPMTELLFCMLRSGR